MPPANPAVVINGVRFTSREWQIAGLVADAVPVKEIAARLGLTDGTVKVYLSRMYEKMRAGHPDAVTCDTRVMLAEWVRCYRCTAFRDQGGEI